MSPVPATVADPDYDGVLAEHSGHPSTDPERFNGFVDRELDRREP